MGTACYRAGKGKRGLAISRALAQDRAAFELDVFPSGEHCSASGTNVFPLATRAIGTIAHDLKGNLSFPGVNPDILGVEKHGAGGV